MKATVLLVDDDPLDLRALALRVEAWGLDVLTARSGTAALAHMAEHAVDLVISDVRMPGLSGDELAAAAARTHPGLPVILITGRGDIRSAVKAMQAGVFDYLVKPPDDEEFRLAIERALEVGRLKRENAFLRAELAAGGMYGEHLIGRSPAMLAVFELVNRVARTDSTVLLTGETGTGKELVAQTVHYKSPRAAQPLVALNCAALNPNLVESELFGHERGAFTGAVAARRGRFEDAHGGSLFLDEIGETSLEFQAKLLRVLQEGQCERIGGNTAIRVDVRLIASTHRDLRQAVQDGTFREDLFYRLSVVPIHLPPLRERREDIPLLAAHFLAVYRKRYQGPAQSLSPRALAQLEGERWPGNVRELQHAIERAVVLARAPVLEPEDFAPQTPANTGASAPEQATLEAALDRATQAHLLAVLDRTGWRKQEAARRLGMDRATLFRLLRKYRLTPPT